MNPIVRAQPPEPQQPAPSAPEAPPPPEDDDASVAGEEDPGAAVDDGVGGPVVRDVPVAPGTPGDEPAGTRPV